MMGRRTAALLCVLLVHALVIYALLMEPLPRAPFAESFESEPITLYLQPLAEEREITISVPS